MRTVILWLGITLAAAICMPAVPAGAGDVEVRDAIPMHLPPGAGAGLDFISPDGRYALLEENPEQGQTWTSLIVLQGRPIRFFELWVDSPSFIRGGRALLYWHHAGGPPGLHLLSLPDGKRRRVFPGRGARHTPADFGSGTEYCPARDEVACTDGMVTLDGAPVQKQTLYAIRLRDGRLRRITTGSLPVWSPDGRRLAFARPTPGASRDSVSQTTWVSDAFGRYARPIAEGAPIGWLADGRYLVVARGDGYVRIDAVGKDAALLSTAPERSGPAVLSPSGRWLAQISYPREPSREPRGSLSFLSTADGARVSLPGDVRQFFWGATDDVLFIVRPDGCFRIRIRFP